ncbi:MAG: hypothetical protein MJ127_02475 [Mogibacterium sp.]|nr:hypothetical protein [Mogibacterium sp.]
MKRKITVAAVLVLSMILASCGGGKTADVTVSDLSISKAGSGYNDLSFSFSSKEGDSWSCVVTGLGKGELSEETANAVADQLGGSFAAGSKTELTAGDDLELIDAEKFGGKDNESRDTGKPYGDANLCWAASVADMMVYGGWAEGDEDSVMSELTENYFDDGSFQETGIKYYLNGINPDQNCAEEAGADTCRDAVFVKNEANEGDFFASTQVRDPGKDGDKIVNPGHANYVASETVCKKVYASDKPASDMADLIINAIDEGSSVGIQLVFYKGESRVGLHALTVSGYVKDAEGKLAALVIADSDNDVEWGRAYLDSTEKTLADRQSCPDTYTMFLTGEFTHNETNYVEVLDYKYSNSKLKYTNSVIHCVTTLKSREAAEEFREEVGDAANNPDLVAVSAENSEMDTVFTVKKGEKVSVPFFISNQSYKGVAAKDKPVAKCRYIFYRDGKKIDELGFDVPLVTDEYATGEANCSFSVSNPYIFKEAGEYRVDVEIEGLYTSGGSGIAEAFSGNNYLKGAGTVTVE